MTSSLIPIILAGGKGERFWPLSRHHRPKQFLCLDGSDRTLLQMTADRLVATTGDWKTIWVITTAHLAAGVQYQLPNLPIDNILVEPEGRDTAPAVAWATLEIARRYGENTVLGFFSADHWIAEQDLFIQTVQAAVELTSQASAIATLGIKPTYPAIGYGYIEHGEAIGTFAGMPAYRVSRFTEKPDRATAENFLATGRFSWNAGMFIFRAATTIAELHTYAPELIQPLEQQGVAAYPSLPKISIDYALMEKTQKACVVPVAFNWDDLGDWNAIERLLKGDQLNVELASHIGLDTKDSIFYAENRDELIVTIGLEDVVVVRDGNATLIVKKERTQDIKKVLKAIQQNPRFEGLL
ncbi:MAG: sugar phosphate nucleotidyltransferase [Cyanobacteria bacterium]|nr:sugar phosphate nucleotidyltransferase [Cyanobacteriota bacterium]MDW8200700.1 mannose-1-phosphate guanylyltransferase [Cyanobacteriota bacterium SKYGB_h_bin112]